MQHIDRIGPGVARRCSARRSRYRSTFQTVIYAPVTLVRAAGPAQGLYGAKITGGGSGGTVAVLGRRGAEEAVAGIADQYARETGYRPLIFSGSSPGASSFGHLRLNKEGKDPGSKVQEKLRKKK